MKKWSSNGKNDTVCYFSECDTCVTLLLDDLDILDHNITHAIEDLDSVAVGAGAIRRLERINQTIHDLTVSS